MLDLFFTSHHSCLSRGDDLLSTSQLFFALLLQAQFLHVQGPNGSHVIFSETNLLLICDHELAFEEGAVKDCCLVLPAFATDIKAELGRELSKLGLKLLDPLAKVSFFQAHAACLNDDGIHLTVDHFLKESVLVSQPEVAKTD